MSDQRPTTVAWFSPLPPVRSGIAAYSAELLPRLRSTFVIDSYPEAEAHDFVWRMRRQPYDLVVYQLGNAPCHDYMWAYLAAYPGLVVLHDARLHHARARHLLQQERFDDYRAELRFDQPGLRPELADYAIEGLGRSIYYFWPMLRVVMQTARGVAVHNRLVAAELRDEFPGVPIAAIRMGVPAIDASADRRRATRAALAIPPDAFVFAAFGKVTAEKRIAPIVTALAALAREGHDAYLLLVGDTDGYPSLHADLAAAGVTGRVRVADYVDDASIGDHLGAADACLCLRWPTALETSASWLRCLAARRATVISDLAHLADVPDGVALRVDLIDEEHALLEAMRRLVADAPARDAIADAGFRYWSSHHTLDAMADDYARLLSEASSSPAPAPRDLPRHFLDDHSDAAAAIARRFGVAVDILR